MNTNAGFLFFGASACFTAKAEVDALKRLQAEIAAELDALLPAILDKAFKGEI
jgi:type I restriction enzyme S subunit